MGLDSRHMMFGGVSVYDTMAQALARSAWLDDALRPLVDQIGLDGFKRLAFSAIEEYERVAFLCDAFQRLRHDKGACEPVKHLLEEWDRIGLAAEFSDLDMDMLKRPVNVGFSGGEKKRAEMVQMGILDPKLAILDETDSGLDIDALRICGEGINAIMRKPDKAVLLITHYQRLLDYVKPDFVHVLAGGRIVRTGGPELALELEEQGYEAVAA